MVITLQAFNSYIILGESNLLDNLFRLLLNKKNDILLCRLYKKYVTKEQVDNTIYLLKLEQGKLNTKNNELLEKLIKACERGKSYIDQSFDTFNIYEPLRLVILDEPYCTISNNIPLEDYDNNDGDPFWMRPEYILEHYSQSYRKI